MAGPYVGKAATFYYPRANATPVVKGAMSQVGSTLEYYVTTRTNAWWNPNVSAIVYDGNTVIENCHIDYAGGYVTLPAAPSGTVTASFTPYTMEKLGGGYGWSISVKGGTAETTEFPAIAGTLADKTFIGTLSEWTGTLKRHWFYGLASLDMVCTVPVPNTKTTWTWINGGANGNNESVVYTTAASALTVTRAVNTTTVKMETGVTTMNAVKAAVAANTTLSTMWSIADYSGHNGSGLPTVAAELHCTGGRDSAEQVADVSSKILCVFYLNNANAATSERLEGVGVLTGLDLNTPIEAVVEADLTFTGTGKLCYHTA